jgi:hypothetical protein
MQNSQLMSVQRLATYAVLVYQMGKLLSAKNQEYHELNKATGTVFTTFHFLRN